MWYTAAKIIYLDSALIDSSTTFTTKLPPVQVWLHAPEGDAAEAVDG